MDEVFNKEYFPEAHKSKHTLKNNKQTSKNVKPVKNYTNDKFYTPKIYKIGAEEKLTDSFRNFLFRNEKFIEQKNVWLKKEQSNQ